MPVSNKTVAPVGCGPACACAPGASGKACDDVAGVDGGAVCVWVPALSVDCCAKTETETRKAAIREALRTGDFTAIRLSDDPLSQPASQKPTGLWPVPDRCYLLPALTAFWGRFFFPSPRPLDGSATNTIATARYAMPQIGTDFWK